MLPLQFVDIPVPYDEPINECVFHLFVQIEEGIVLNVAGGLIIEHPLVLPYIKQVVSF